MVIRKIKFKMSIKEINFEYEGDQEKAEQLQGAIVSTLGALTDAQSGIIDVEPLPARISGCSPHRTYQ